MIRKVCLLSCPIAEARSKAMCRQPGPHAVDKLPHGLAVHGEWRIAGTLLDDLDGTNRQRHTMLFAALHPGCRDDPQLALQIEFTSPSAEYLACPRRRQDGEFERPCRERCTLAQFFHEARKLDVRQCLMMP